MRELLFGDTRGGRVTRDCQCGGACGPCSGIGAITAYDGRGPLTRCTARGQELAAGALGDVVCTPAEAEAARRAVAQLEAIFQLAGEPAKFLPLMKPIRDDWKEYDDALVFYTFCQAKEIGQRAAALSARIAAAYNIAAPATDPSLNPGPAGQLTDWLNKAGSLIAGAVAVYAAVKIVPPLLGAVTPTSRPAPRRRKRATGRQKVRL